MLFHLPGNGAVQLGLRVHSSLPGQYASSDYFSELSKERSKEMLEGKMYLCNSRGVATFMNEPPVSSDASTKAKSD